MPDSDPGWKYTHTHTLTSPPPLSHLQKGLVADLPLHHLQVLLRQRASIGRQPELAEGQCRGRPPQDVGLALVHQPHKHAGVLLMQLQLPQLQGARRVVDALAGNKLFIVPDYLMTDRKLLNAIHCPYRQSYKLLFC